VKLALLSEIGASCPTPAIYLVDSEWESSPALEQWLSTTRVALHRTRG
jgi:FMN reductase